MVNLCILCKLSGLESMHAKTRLKAPEKSWKGGQFAVFTKNFDFSDLQNGIRMHYLVPQERNNIADVLTFKRTKKF